MCLHEKKNTFYKTGPKLTPLCWKMLVKTQLTACICSQERNQSAGPAGTRASWKLLTHASARVQPWALRSHRINTALYLQRPIAQESRVCFNVSLRQVPWAAAPRDACSQGDTVPFPAHGPSRSAPRLAQLVLEEQEEMWVPSSPSIPSPPALRPGRCCELKYTGFCSYGGTSGVGNLARGQVSPRVTEPGFSFP